MRVEFLGVPVDVLSLDQTLARVAAAMHARRRCQHVALNVAKLVKMRRDPDLRSDVVESDIVGIDGMGIVWGMRLLGLPAAERVAGIDLFERVLELCAREGFRPYILGARKEVLEQAVANLKDRLPVLTMAGWHDGFFGAEREEEIVAAIRDTHADCLFIALPTPRKERLLAKFRDGLGVSFVMGIGGSVDVLGGAVSRAPAWMQAYGLEWLYRLLQEPRRMFWRYASTNTVFAGLLVRAWFAKRFASLLRQEASR